MEKYDGATIYFGKLNLYSSELIDNKSNADIKTIQDIFSTNAPFSSSHFFEDYTMLPVPLPYNKRYQELGYIDVKDLWDINHKII